MPVLIAAETTFDVDALLFDKDGTLIPFAPTWTTWGHTLVETLADTAAALTGLRPTLNRPLHTDPQRSFGRHDLHLATGDGLRTRLVEELVDHGVGVDDAERLLGQALRVADEAMARHELRAYPEAGDAVRRCTGSGVMVGVVTGDDRDRARGQLTTIGILEHCRTIVGGDAGVPGKPDPAPLLLACDELGVAPARVAYIGDSLVDLTAARGAGVHAIAFAPVQDGPPGAWTCDADAVVTTHAQLAVSRSAADA